MLGHSMVIDLG